MAPLLPQKKDVAVLPLSHPVCGLEVRASCFSQSCNEKVSRKMLKMLEMCAPTCAASGRTQSDCPCLCVVTSLPQPPLPKAGKKLSGSSEIISSETQIKTPIKFRSAELQF